MKIKKETDAAEIFGTITSHLSTVIISAFIGLGLAGVLTFFIIPPRYDSVTELIVTLPSTEEADAGNVDTNLRLLKTYKDFIKGNLVMDHVSKQMKSRYEINLSNEKLKKSIQVEQAEDSQMFSITAESTDSKVAADLANTTAEVFQKDVQQVLNADQIVITSKAEPTSKPVSPNNTLNLTIGFIIGCLIGVLFVLISNVFNRKLTNEKFIIEEMTSPVLGNIAQLSDEEMKNTILHQSKYVNIKENDYGINSRRRTRKRGE